MIAFILVVATVSMYETWHMLHKGMKKEMALFWIGASLSTYLGILYFSNPYKYSFSSLVLNIFK